MATTLANSEVLRQSRGEHARGTAFRGVRVFAIPSGDVSGLRSEFTSSAGNLWPGIATEWSATTDYVVDDEVIGDGSPDSFHYKCILGNGPGGVGAQEPPNETYWTRVRTTRSIVEYRIEKEFPGRPGYSRVTSWYETPSRRRILRDNLGKGLIEVTVGHQMVRQRREQVVASGESVVRVIEGPVIPETWLAGTAYTAGDLVQGDGTPDTLPYICVTGNTGNQPPNATYWALYNGKYKVIEGTNMWPKAVCTIKIISATSDIDLSTEIALLGKYNDAQLANIGNVAAKTLLYVGYHATRVPQENDISDQTRVFWYDPDGWEATCTVQRFRKLVVETQVKNAAGTNVSGQFARVTGWYTDEAEGTREVSLGGASFTAFNNMVNWNT